MLRFASACMAVVVASSACGSPSTEHPSATPIDELVSTTTTTAEPASAGDEVAMARAADYLVGTFDKIDAASLAIIDYIGRRFGLSQLATARSVAEQRYPGNVAADDLALQRLVLPESPAPADVSSASPTTQLLTTALHCDRAPPGPEYAMSLRSSLQQGGFDATHAALALGWMRELGCAVETETELVAEADRALLDAFDAGAGAGVIDLRLEQAAFREYLTSEPINDAAWIDAVRAAQRADGGWGQNGPSSSSSWHTTILAIWDLAAATRPSADVPMIVSS